MRTSTRVCKEIEELHYKIVGAVQYLHSVKELLDKNAIQPVPEALYTQTTINSLMNYCGQLRELYEELKTAPLGVP